MDQVITDRMSPVHPPRVVIGLVGVVLVEEVIGAVPMDRPVRIAEKIRRRGEVIRGPIAVARLSPAVGLGTHRRRPLKETLT